MRVTDCAVGAKLLGFQPVSVGVGVAHQRYSQLPAQFGAAIHYPNSPNPVLETTYGRWWGIGTWHTFEKGWQAGTYFFWPVLASLFCAAAPWFPWSKRFGLRSLLIAMTLAAAVLGVTTYRINSLIPLIPN